MTGPCPPDEELERLLAPTIVGAGLQALEAHVAGCPACQRRLEQLNWGGTTRPVWLADPDKPVTEVQRTMNLTPTLAAGPPASADPDTLPAPPEVIGRYQVRSALGAG